MTTTSNPWDAIFANEGVYFSEPHEAMPRLAQTLQDRHASMLLDLGCGSGRHVLYFARRGFQVFGLDDSPNGLLLTQQALTASGLTADLRQQDIYRPLPYPNAFFDAVISVQTLHHTMSAQIAGLAAEIWRVTKSQGLLYVTVPKLRNQGTSFQEIEPRTLVPLDGPEAGLPHHYFTPQELHATFGRFEHRSIRLDTNKHYCLSATKP